MLRKQKLLQMINNQGRNHPWGHGHPLLSSTTSDKSIRTPMYLTSRETKCLYYVVIFVKNIGVLILLSGVVEDRRGWPWPLGWFLPWIFIIWSNFCFLNMLVLCCYLGQEHRGPYAPIWSCRGLKRMTMTSRMVPTLIIYHLKQLLFS